MDRRRFLRACGIGAAALATPRRLRAAPRRPNVLFVYTDDQREDTIGALGNPHIQTPNLDSLVKRGTVFANAYCMGGFSGAVCLPARLMTLRGRSWFAVRGLKGDFPTFPKAMKQAGYVTYHVGKRGNTDQLVQKQFDRSTYIARSPEPGKPLADLTIGHLRKHDRGKPFFMYLAGPAPHDPRVAPKAYMDRYDVDKIPLPANYLPFHPVNNGEMFIRDERLAPWPRTEAEIRRHLRDYYGMITHLDAQLGRIFQTLADLGLRENTLIVFSSDQGIAVGSHGLMGKQNLYEHSMGVPLIFAGPGIPQGKVVDAFAYGFDVFPTVCDLVGAPVPKGLDGKSLAPVLRGQKHAVRDTVLLGYRDVQRAARRGRWKLIRYPRIAYTQLFDLEADPHETRDLADDPAHADRVKEMMAVLAEQQKLFGDACLLTAPNPTPAKVDLGFFKNRPPSRRRPKKRKPGGRKESQ